MVTIVGGKMPAALGAVGLATASTASTAITLVVSEPPPGLGRDLRILAIAAAFFAGVAELSAAVWPRGRRAAGGKLMYASVVPLVVLVGLSLASLCG